MPIPDTPKWRKLRNLLRRPPTPPRPLGSGRKRPKRKGGEPEREPVEPNNPRPLSGGAAAELEYDA